MPEKYEFTMLVADGCGHCAEAKKILADKISSGKIKIADISREDAALDLANKYNVNAVPTIIVKDKKTQIGEACELSITGKNVICKDKEVEL